MLNKKVLFIDPDNCPFRISAHMKTLLYDFHMMGLITNSKAPLHLIDIDKSVISIPNEQKLVHLAFPIHLDSGFGCVPTNILRTSLQDIKHFTNKAFPLEVYEV